MEFSEKEIKLKEAVEIFRCEVGAPSNSLEWYRRLARRLGIMIIGPSNIRVFKKSGIWWVDKEDFFGAIEKHRNSQKQLRSVTSDHAIGVFHVVDGATIKTERGGHRIKGDFRFEWSDYEKFRRRSLGAWYCNRCNAVAEEEHGKEECNTCRNWGDCGEDCTLSRVYCRKCGTSLEL
jgi:hypothetical protein